MSMNLILKRKPQPLAPFTFLRPTAKITFLRPPCTNFFFHAPNYQYYYFTTLLVENISCISVFSKFQTFPLFIYKWNKEHDKVRYFLIKRKCSKLSQNWVSLSTFFGKKWICEIKNRSERNNYFLLVCYLQQEKCRKSLKVLRK